MKQQGKDIGLCLCKVCRQLNSSELTHCQRCETELHVRDYSSLQKSWALLITAAILLVPANIYPITMLTNQGQVRHDTIFSGILHLVHSDMLPIAIIVFTASILVPWIKIIGLSIYLCAISFDIPISKKKLMVGFHIIEWIGRWSMLDIFVIAILVAVVNFGRLATIEANLGAVAFASVVILTMLAAVTFDPRLIWDNTESDDDHD